MTLLFSMYLPKIFFYFALVIINLQEEIKKYIHVNILNSYNKAFVLHTKKRICCLINHTKIVDLDAFNNLFDKEKDFIVLPEDPFFPGKSDLIKIFIMVFRYFIYKSLSFPIFILTSKVY